MRKPDLVQAVDRGDPFEPGPAPAGQADLTGRALDDIAPLMSPNMCNATYLEMN